MSKRGKDIKCFEDLPLDVQATINRISGSNEEKAKRTAIAINYQHLFPPDNTYKGFIDRLYSPEHIEHCRKVERWDKKAVADGRGGPL